MILKPRIINLGMRKKPGIMGCPGPLKTMGNRKMVQRSPGNVSLFDFIYLYFFFYSYFFVFVSFQHKTCLKSSRSEKSLSVRLAVLDFHTSACFFSFLFFFFSVTLRFGWRKNITLQLCEEGERLSVCLWRPPCA